MYQGEYNGSKKHDADLPYVLDRAWKAGIESMIVTGGSLTDSAQAIELSKQEGKHINIPHRWDRGESLSLPGLAYIWIQFIHIDLR